MRNVSGCYSTRGSNDAFLARFEIFWTGAIRARLRDIHEKRHLYWITLVRSTIASNTSQSSALIIASW